MASVATRIGSGCVDPVKCELKAVKREVSGRKSQRCGQTRTVFADVLRLYTDYNSKLGESENL